MKFVRSILLMATLGFGASAADISGTWKAVFTGPLDDRPKMVSEMIFNLTATWDSVSGTAHMAAWPGEATVRDGRIEGDRIYFTVVGRNPWRSKSALGEASGLPKLTFSGRVQGRDVRLTLMWKSIMLYGNQDASRVYEMKGTRISD